MKYPIHIILTCKHETTKHQTIKHLYASINNNPNCIALIEFEAEVVHIWPFVKRMNSRVDRRGQTNLVPEDQQELVPRQGRADVALKADGEARHP